jgi:catechol 2,3-dioxygenase-like lactoylglutathione lyase family enzyme
VTDATGPVREINAITLATTDMAGAVAFYEALGLGLRYGGPRAEFSSFHVGTGYLNLQLDPAYVPPGRVWGRVILWVDDVDDCYDRVRAAGYAPGTEPADAPWGERYFHVRDPDGHEVSIARPLDG